MTSSSFGGFVRDAQQAGDLVVQPRMGLANPFEMRAGLVATRDADAVTVGTITLDSYTRVGQWEMAEQALRSGQGLNGYPIVTHDIATTRQVLHGIAGPDFPVQVRHGSAQPERIVRALVAAGLTATEGGPVSYCLPYGRVPLSDAVRSWRTACTTLAQLRDADVEPHLESFGGCLMGQLCPPSLLLATAILEGLFFTQHGIASVSLSYAQQTNFTQDVEAVHALRALAARFLSAVDVHVVLYAYMGVYPRTAAGAQLLLVSAARLARETGAARLIVKTAAEAYRIPTVAENVSALELAGRGGGAGGSWAAPSDSGIHAEATALVEAVLDLDPDVGRALVKAFACGYLDVPFCLHPDNAGRSRSRLEDDGQLTWTRTGSMPLAPSSERPGQRDLTSAELLHSLSYLERTFDRAALESSFALAGAPGSTDRRTRGPS